ncbi:hypothetical protein V3I01_07975 [Sphingomonas sp. gentR]|uniref:hypothetical protein n=1 Tax=unclassified Sphingomonas TaxID=196159 RepID=UPI0009726A64|nr:hypothetical protein [Sphingomonas sp. LK11]APX66268.1 hypothetical protein AV944_11005 [Sphingomonas sp. LK11]
MSIRTAGELRSFLADVLVDIRAKRVTPDEAGAIAKVAGEINKSLAVEVQTALASGVKKPVPGSMAIGSPDAPRLLPEGESGDGEIDEPEPTKPQKNITENTPAADPIDPAKVPPSKPMRLDDATANFKRNQQDGDRVWCEQCDMRVTTSQAVGCKSKFCKAKEAA